MRLAITTLATVAIAGAAIVMLAPSQAQERPAAGAAAAGKFDLSREHRAGRIVYRLAKGVPDSASAALEEKVHATSGRILWPGLLSMMQLPPEADLAAALATLAADPRVAYAQPSWIYHSINTPNDTNFNLQWNMDQANDADIDAPEAWNTATDATNAIVAVIDTGVQYDHPDLAANMWINPGEIPANGIDDDNNGWIDDVHGIDTVNNDGDPMDDFFHGTHCAGIIGAVGNNSTGVAGVCWSARIMALKFLDSGGSGDTANAITCLQYATSFGVKVSSNSWGGYGGGGGDPALYAAISAAGDAGMLFCAAAGNNSINIEGQDWLPGGFDLDSIIDVAATDSNDNLAWFSNYGPISVDLGAPGDSIYSTLLGSTYGYESGTSMACPHVAGVATMLFAQSNTTSVPLVKSWILDSVDPLNSLNGITVTGGRLNLNNALATMCTTPASATTYGSGYPGLGGNIPTLTAPQLPVLGLGTEIQVSNSIGFLSTTGLLVFGLSSANIPTSAGGDILVTPLLMLPLSIPPAGLSLTSTLPTDCSIDGVHAYLQVLEIDPFAAHNISFTAGLDLVIGV